MKLLATNSTAKAVQEQHPRVVWDLRGLGRGAGLARAALHALEPASVGLGLGFQAPLRCGHLALGQGANRPKGSWYTTPSPWHVRQGTKTITQPPLNFVPQNSGGPRPARRARRPGPGA